MRLAVHRRFYGRKKFGSFKKEQPLRTVPIKRKPDRKMELLKRVWTECNYERCKDWDFLGTAEDPLEGLRPFQNKIRSMIGQSRISPKDIGAFSLVMKQYENEQHFPEKAGHFLTFLINHSRSKTFVVHTMHLDRLIDCFGIQNRKHITVKGSLGDDAGMWMEGGTIVVEGDVGDSAGRSSEGRLVIKGNAGENLGECLLPEGIIEIEGEFKSLGDVVGASIYHKGKALSDSDDWEGATMYGDVHFVYVEEDDE